MLDYLFRLNLAVLLLLLVLWAALYTKFVYGFICHGLPRTFGVYYLIWQNKIEYLLLLTISSLIHTTSVKVNFSHQ